jgi:hypothetical protein
MAKRPRRNLELAHAEAWRGFYEMNRPAMAALFAEFGLYDRLGSNDPHDALRREGQRDVLLRLVQLIGLKAEAIPTDAWEGADILDRMLNADNR